MSKSVLLMSCCLCALLFLACAKPDATTNRESTNSSVAPTAASPAPTTATTVANAGDKIGVAECDDFITKYESCISTKVPEAVRPSLTSSIATWRASWKKSAETAEGRAALVNICKNQLEAAKPSLKAYGCTL